MNNITFANKAKEIANNYKTLYVMGCFGSPMNATNKNRYCNNHSYNKQSARTSKIRNASADTFGFDCVCLIKGILWGWNGDVNKTYGGAVYASNGVPDVSANGMMNYCTGVSTNFNNIEIGEAVWMEGHIGIYIGDGLAVECTPIWKDCVQITAVGNIGKKNGYNTRTWTKHGKLKFIDYVNTTSQSTNTDKFKGISDEELARRVWAGEFGNGDARRNALGSRFDAVQALVNKGVGKPSSSSQTSTSTQSVDILELVKKTIRGDFGNGDARKNALGSNYSEVQRQVNLNYQYGTTRWDNIRLY